MSNRIEKHFCFLIFLYLNIFERKLEEQTLENSLAVSLKNAVDPWTMQESGAPTPAQ